MNVTCIIVGDSSLIWKVLKANNFQEHGKKFKVAYPNVRLYNVSSSTIQPYELIDTIIFQLSTVD